MIILFIVLIIIYSLPVYYVGLRTWQTFFYKKIKAVYFWTSFLLISFLSYPIPRLYSLFFPDTPDWPLTLIGFYWLGIIYYSTIIIGLLDLLRIMNRRFKILAPKHTAKCSRVIALFVPVLVVGIILLGVYNANNPVVREYEITINKPTITSQTLNVIMVSDIHIGPVVDSKRLLKLVNMINDLNPDIVLLPGDIFDESINPFIEQNMAQILRLLHPRLGTFAVLGNHEYVIMNVDSAISNLTKAGITVLRDQIILVDNSFYIVGRDDRSKKRFDGHDRLPLQNIIGGADKTRPLILLDHQPFNLNEARQAEIDLQFSGHTHVGQMFPNNLITEAIYEIDHGLLKNGAYHIIVSSGFGTWGPPLRTSAKPEIVQIKLIFNPGQ